MTISEAVRGAWRRVAGVSSADSLRGMEKKRRTSSLPSIFNSYGPLVEAMPKATPYNLRRFSETPIARRAINCIKDRIAGMRWRVQPRAGYSLDTIPDGAARVRILTSNFESPNPDDSFRSLAEQVLEDIIVGGYGAIEVQVNPGWEESSVMSHGENPHFSQRQGEVGHPHPHSQGVPTQQAPLAMWAVDGASIRVNLEWDGSPHSQRYLQVNDSLNSKIELDDDELIYIRLNPRTHTPFGLGRLEVAFETINSFLGAHRYASRLPRTPWCSMRCGCRI